MSAAQNAADREPGWWSVTRGSGPVIATAIHDGSGLRSEVRRLIRLSDPDRLREEDPHTGTIIDAVPTRVIAHRSRFEVDLNRPRADAVYRTPAQSWGLEVWSRPPDEALVRRSLRIHDRFYGMMDGLLHGLCEDHGGFVLLDVHSYNHRRDGPDATPTGRDRAPEVNIGTYSMPAGRWDRVVDAVCDTVRGFDYRGRTLDVRRNVAFQGKGELARFVHRRFPEQGCAVAIEFKKFFMDEWTGVPFSHDIATLRKLVAALVPVLTSVAAPRTALAG